MKGFMMTTKDAGELELDAEELELDAAESAPAASLVGTQSRRSRLTGWFGRNRVLGLGLVVVGIAIVAVGVVAVVAMTGSDGDTTEDEVSQPLSANPVVASYQEQLPALAEGVRLNPDDPKALRDYGVALYATGDVSRAKDQYEAELKINESDPVLLNNLANVYRDLGSYDQALEFYQRAISLDSTSVTAYMNLANLYQYTLDQKDLGITTLKDAIVNLPDNQDLGVLLGIAYEQNGDVDEALVTFETVLTQNPGNAAALAGVERLEA
jgi:tetratricopeptide (TPR) repeat protein